MGFDNQILVGNLVSKFSFSLHHPESAEGQSSAAEDRAAKLKQLLVKSKKDLSDAKKTVSVSI